MLLEGSVPSTVIDLAGDERKGPRTVAHRIYRITVLKKKP